MLVLSWVLVHAPPSRKEYLAESLGFNPRKATRRTSGDKVDIQVSGFGTHVRR